MNTTIRIIAIFAAATLAACGSDDTASTSSSSSGATDTASSSSGADGASSSSGADGASSSSGADGASSSSGADATSSSSGADAATAAKYKTCATLGDCALKDCTAAKFADKCANTCIAAATAEAATTGGALLGCVQAKCVPSCKDSKDADCLGDCIRGTCGGELLTCLDEGKNGDKTCMAGGLGCMEACKGAFECSAKCYNDLTKDAQGKFKAAAACSGNPFAAGCPEAMVGCIEPKGTDKCWAGWGCINACPKDGEGDPESKCMMGCIAKGSKDSAIELFKMMGVCAAEKPECLATMYDCQAPAGTDKCAATAECIGKCADDDKKFGCMFECVGKSTKDSATKVKDFLTCAAADDTTSADCKPKVEACMADK